MMGIRLIFVLIACSVCWPTAAQQLSRASILSHNDYAQALPFENAYSQGVGFIEADVLLRDGELIVAHSANEIEMQKTLATLYLEPLQQKIIANGGSAYSDQHKILTLMIDFKTEGSTTIRALLKILETYPTLSNCKTLWVVISGNVPPRDLWHTFPAYIYFDGRPGQLYSPRDLARIAFISDDYKKYTDDIKDVVEESHQLNKRFRFWGAPDEERAWLMLIQNGVDILGTDHVNELAAYIDRRLKEKSLVK
jgi:alkaline phosphatase